MTLVLPEVTLVCVDTRTPELALEAIARCRAQASFGDAVLFAEPGRMPNAPPGLRIEPAQVDGAPVDSVQAYSRFMLRGLFEHVHTSHVLVMQWDSWIIDASCWEPGFLQWDYIGAPFTGEPEHRSVGNGGFSLRSRRLLAALQDPSFEARHPEDLCLCHDHRARLEADHTIRFAPRDVASRFAYERLVPPGPTFGFHGLFNLHGVLATAQLDALLDRLPDEMARGLDAHDLARELIAQGRLDSAARIVDKRKRLRMNDRRTLRLKAQLALARWRA